MKLRALDPVLHPQYEDILHKKSSFVDHFYQLISHSIKPPFAISVDGLWGTGKTTVMQMLQSKLRGRDGGYPVFWFNPWQYQEAESIVLAFLQRFADEMLGTVDKTIRESLKILGTIGLLGIDVTLSALPGAIITLLGKLGDPEKIKKTGELLEKEYEKYKDIIEIIQNDFKKLLNGVSAKHEGRPVIIFFDDLDRCLPDKTIQLLEAIKNLFVVPDSKVIFICGIDTHIAKQFIRSHYKEIEDTFAIEYFRKIFNLTVSMPYSPDIYKLLTKYIDELDDEKTLANQKADELAKIVHILGIQAKMSSVRKYLNVINNFYMFQKFNPNYTFDEKGDFVIHLLIVKEAWQPLYERIIAEAAQEPTKTVGELIENCIKKDGLRPEQGEFLQDYFTKSNFPFHNYNLSKWLLDYPTLA